IISPVFALALPSCEGVVDDFPAGESNAAPPTTIVPGPSDGLADFSLVRTRCHGHGSRCSPGAEPDAGTVRDAGTTATPDAGTTGTAALSWVAPTTNTDGSPLTDLAGYKVHYGLAAGSYTTVVDIGMASCALSGGVTQCNYSVTGLISGTWYFVVSAYNTGGV